jgi:hypothetical protein
MRTPCIAPRRPRAAPRPPCILHFILLSSTHVIKFDFYTNLSAPNRRVRSKIYGGSAAPTQVSARRPTPDAASAAASARAAASFPHPQIHPMMNATQDGPPPSLPLGPLLGNLPAHLFQQEVLRRLGPTDLASLAGAGRGCAAAVAATVLMQWANRVKGTPATYYFPPLCLKEACSYAARAGNLEVMKWLHNTGCPWDARTCAWAAWHGNLTVLRWARAHHCPWASTTCNYAAEGGHLAVLQWAREHHCPWDSHVCSYAARAGHLVVLQWLREHNCPWGTNICVCAADAGQLEVLQWVRENDATRHVWNERRVRLFAGGPRKQEVLAWLDDLSGL